MSYRPTFPLGFLGATDYNVVITINPDLTVTVVTDFEGQPPIDQDVVDDYCVGVFNLSTSTINKIRFDLNAPAFPVSVFDFDSSASVANGPYISSSPGVYKDNIQDWGTPAPNQSILPPGYVRTGYEGPDNYFTNGGVVPFLSGTNPSDVHFPLGIPPGGETFFGLEQLIFGSDAGAITIFSTPPPPPDAPPTSEEDLPPPLGAGPPPTRLRRAIDVQDQIQRWLIRTGHIRGLGPSTIDDLQLTLKRGVGPVAVGGTDVEPTIWVRANRDNKGFGRWVKKGLGLKGDRVMTLQFGGFGSARDWQIEVGTSDDCEIELRKLEILQTPLGH